MNTDLMFSSETDMWSTPKNLFDELNSKFNFVLDVCATKENAKCEKYFSKEQDGLKQNWKEYEGFKWMNPPYGREIGKWVKKASEERQVVCLLPARTDTKWFHEYIYLFKYYNYYSQIEIHFIKGRLKFGDCKNSAPFPSMIVIFK